MATTVNREDIFANDPENLLLNTVAKDVSTTTNYIVQLSGDKQVWREFNLFNIDLKGSHIQNFWVEKNSDNNFPFYVTTTPTFDYEDYLYDNPFQNSFGIVYTKEKGYSYWFSVTTKIDDKSTTIFNIEPVDLVDFYKNEGTVSNRLLEEAKKWSRGSKIPFSNLVANQLMLKNPNLRTEREALILAKDVIKSWKNVALLFDRYIKRYFPTGTPSKPDLTKLQIGDRVFIPTTKRGKFLTEGMSSAVDKAKERNQPFLYVTDTFYGTDDPNKIILNSEYDDDGDYFNVEGDGLELFQRNPPKTFETNRTGEILYIIQEDHSEKEYAEFRGYKYFKPNRTRTEWAYFESTDQAYRKYNAVQVDITLRYKKTIGSPREGMSFRLERRKNVQFHTEFLTDLKEIEQTINSIDQYLRENTGEDYAEEFYQVATTILEAIKNDEIIFPKSDFKPTPDCEADPTKIVSGQVKKFYEANKTRIDKLNPKIMCKIIQALVSLSEYEECGVGSSESLPKAKSDLLSRISKLKI